VLLIFLPIEPINGVHIYQGDFRSPSIINSITTIAPNRRIDVVLSDMLMNTSGISSADHSRSIDLVINALELAQELLRPGGSFLAKFLRGSDDKYLVDECGKVFSSTKLVKPKSSRSESAEIYILCLKKI
jgi:23S rRNA (uridine2552-2'-O)-methyltransferase